MGWPLMCVAALACVAGCGSGGSRGSADLGQDAPPVEYQVAASLRALAVGPQTFALAGDGSSGRRYNLNYASKRDGMAAFRGVTYPISRYDTLMSSEQTASVRDVGYYYFTDHQFRLVAKTSGLNSSTTVYANFSTMPDSAAIGANGPLYTADVYGFGGASNLIETESATWSVEQDGSAHAKVCMTADALAQSPEGVSGSEKYCVHFAQDGRKTGYSVTIATADERVVFNRDGVPVQFPR